jgi:hypothetical protein
MSEISWIPTKYENTTFFADNVSLDGDLKETYKLSNKRDLQRECMAFEKKGWVNLRPHQDLSDIFMEI